MGSAAGNPAGVLRNERVKMGEIGETGQLNPQPNSIPGYGLDLNNLEVRELNWN